MNKLQLKPGGNSKKGMKSNVSLDGNKNLLEHEEYSYIKEI